MQRPFAARRPGGAPDRRVAAIGLSICATVVLVAVAFAHAPLPEIDVRDPAAARELVALMQAGERGRWIVSYDFTRTLTNGRVLREVMTEGRGVALHVVVTGSVMTIERGDRSYTCGAVGRRTGCTQSGSGVVLPASEVLRVAVGLGAYNVVRLPDVTIAGLAAHCFRVLATGRGGLPGLGVETDQCLSADGIPLRGFVVRAPGIVDDQVAVAVEPRATTSDVEALAAGFARNPSSSQG